MSHTKLISIVIPAYREEKNIPLIYDELVAILHPLKGYDYEIIFVNDGSPDRTWQAIERLCDKDARVRGVNLSRNFGKELALFSGVEHTGGDIIITTDADGQRPSRVILQFLNEHAKGYDIVYGVRTKMNRGFLRRIASNSFNKLMRLISTVKFDSAVTDFMLLDRKILPHLLQYRNKNIIFRGVVLDLGFKINKVFFEEPERLNGDSKFGFLKLWKLAIDSIINFSIFPLRFLAYFGFFITVGSFILGNFMFFSRFIFDDPFHITNTAFLVVFNLFFSGVTLTALGIVGFYVANIHEQVIGRPLYIVKDKLNF